MVQTIYDKTGYAKAEIAPDDSSTQVKEVQGDNISHSLSPIMPT